MKVATGIIAVSCLVLNGCVTALTMNATEDRFDFNANKVRVAENNEFLIDGIAHEMTWSKRRFLIATEKEVEKSISPEPSSWREGVPVYRFAGKRGWKIIPESIKDSDADSNMIPKQFISAKEYDAFSIPFTLKGKDVILTYQESEFVHLHWWSYPARVILVPLSVCADVVVTPLFLLWSAITGYRG